MKIKQLFHSFKDDCLPFPKIIKFRKGLLWWLEAGIKPYKKEAGKIRRKYCSACGWPLVYLDELYDIPLEACFPDTVAVCSLCGDEFKEYYDLCDEKVQAVLPR